MISVEVQHLSRRFKEIKALKDVSLCFEAGMIHGLIGPEGAGKTTLLRTLLGLLDCKEGHILYQKDDAPITLKKVRAHIAYMPEKQSLYGDLSVREHLHFFKDLYGIPPQEFQQRADVLLHLTRLEKFKDRAARQLSGGMYKKLGLMCALLRAPQMVLLDEPTNGVDPISRREFWAMLHELRFEKNITIIMATAYMDEAERCEKVHLLEGGNVIDSGVPQDLMRRYAVDNFDELFIKKAEQA